MGGMDSRRTSAAAFTTLVAPQQHHSPSSQLCRSFQPCRLRMVLWTRTIAPMAGLIGRRVGQWARRSGAAGFTARAALARVRVAPLSLRRQHLMIATLASAIGWQAGASQRRIGAARTPARVALQLLVAVHEGVFDSHNARNHVFICCGL